MSNVVEKRQCPKCKEDGKDTSQDNLAVYEDGGTFCFSCSYFTTATISNGTGNKDPLVSVHYDDIKTRGLTKESCEFMCYGLDDNNNHVANYYKGTVLIAQKIRKNNKKFSILGEGKDLRLWNIDNWRGDKDKVIVITEGEIDAVSVAQATNLNIPVVSLPSGAASAVGALKKDLEKLLKFKQVILMFDMDEPGQKAAEECAGLFSPGKVCIARLTEKDANACLIAGKKEEIVKAVFSSPVYTPPGLVDWEELDVKDLLIPDERGLTIGYPKLNNMVRGYVKGRLHTITALSGAGKTTISKEFIYELLTKHSKKIGGIFLEESVKESALSLIAIDNDTPIKILRENPSLLKEDIFTKSFNKFKHKIVLTGEFDLSKPEEILTKLEYMAVSKEVDYIIYDNLSFTIGGSPSSEEGERKYIDIIMGRLRSLVHRTGVGVLMLVQMVKVDIRNMRKDNKDSDWDEIHASDIKGSSSILQGSDTIIALECHKLQHDLRRIKVLKNRVGGVTGPADTLRFVESTGRLVLA